LKKKRIMYLLLGLLQRLKFLICGSSIAHHSIVGANCFISSQVAVSGFCTIGESCFLGVNSCTKDHVNIAKDTFVGAGAVVIQDTEPGKIYVGNPAKPLPDRTVESLIIA
jgi:UDP-3-O-[3-hydroxymyristoyl] glucosamine N-acyltransferase